MDLCDRIHGVVASLLRAARRWWQAAAQGRRRNPRIPPNKVCAGALEWGCSGQSRLCVMLLLLVAVLPWRETKAMPASASCGFFNKAWVLLVCSSTSSTSFVRPFLKSAVAAILAGIGASGVVPATVLGNGKLGFLVLLDGGEREGLWCNFYFSVRSFLLLSGTHVLFPDRKSVV